MPNIRGRGGERAGGTIDETVEQADVPDDSTGQRRPAQPSGMVAKVAR